MSGQPPKAGDQFTMASNDLEILFTLLLKRDYKILGPTIRDGAIVCDELATVSQLPQGWTDEQEAATYRLKKRDDDAYFGYTLGPQAWKRYLHEPRKMFWAAEKDRNVFQINKDNPHRYKKAFLGVRPCELAAIAVMDKTMLDGPYRDSAYAALRADTLIIAVNCAEAGNTCFCVSMKTGPVANSGFDLAMTEIIESNKHCFVIEIGSDAGAEIASSLKMAASKPDDIRAAEAIHTNTANQMGRQIDTKGVKELLERNHDNPRWDDVAKRCLSCANCTLVCPTCFCTSVEDTTDLTGKHAERWQKWDSCYTVDFSYIHGGSIRVSTKSRYRQWATHKFSSWQTQFGTFGCIGCGRCITWCPAAIDITTEIRAIRESEKTAKSSLIEKEK
jgi:formate hydrogenlyase subunit 6/NADH:ubiquinone oxidoreductase subunit I